MSLIQRCPLREVPLYFPNEDHYDHCIPACIYTVLYLYTHPQDIVNLLMTGLAVSNVFDGNLDLDSGGSSKVGSLIPIPLSVESNISFPYFEFYSKCVYL